MCGLRNWMWLVPTGLVVTVGCGWCPRVWPWQLDVIGTHEFGDASWMWFAPAYVAVAFGCGSLLTFAARGQLEVVGVPVFAGASFWMWFVPVCVSVAGVCCWLPTRVAMADDCGWLPRVWRWRLNVFGAYVCG